MDKNSFLTLVAPLVQAENQKRGNPLYSSVVIAQSILETGWGSSSLMMNAKAIFGIKAGNGLQSCEERTGNEARDGQVCPPPRPHCLLAQPPDEAHVPLK